jgi:hypothetical protein
MNIITQETPSSREVKKITQQSAMGYALSTHGKEKKFIQNLNRETFREYTVLDT